MFHVSTLIIVYWFKVFEYGHFRIPRSLYGRASTVTVLIRHYTWPSVRFSVLAPDSDILIAVCHLINEFPFLIILEQKKTLIRKTII